jgi:hypothetical protein
MLVRDWLKCFNKVAPCVSVMGQGQRRTSTKVSTVVLPIRVD